jgi:hypothetical protein
MPRLNNFIQIIITFILACFAWIFFRANSVEDAFLIVSKMFSAGGNLYIGEMQHFLLGFFVIGLLLFFEIFQEYKTKILLPFKTNSWLKEEFAYASLVILILLFGVFDGGQFIYFQF